MLANRGVDQRRPAGIRDDQLELEVLERRRIEGIFSSTRGAPMRHDPSRHDHDFALGKELPRSVVERHAGDRGHGLHARLARHAVSRQELFHRDARLCQAEKTTALHPGNFQNFSVYDEFLSVMGA